MPNQFSVGKGIKWAREKAKLTQSHLARKVGLTVNFVSRVENDRKGISLVHILKIAEATEVSVAEIFVMAGDSNNGLIRQLQAMVENQIPEEKLDINVTPSVVTRFF